MKHSISTEKKTNWQIINLSQWIQQNISFNFLEILLYLHGKPFIPTTCPTFFSPSSPKSDFEAFFWWSFIINIYWHAWIQFIIMTKTIKIQFANWNFAVVEYWCIFQPYFTPWCLKKKRVGFQILLTHHFAAKGPKPPHQTDAQE